MAPERAGEDVIIALPGNAGNRRAESEATRSLAWSTGCWSSTTAATATIRASRRKTELFAGKRRPSWRWPEALAPSSRLYVFGYSLGGAVALEMAA